MICSKTTGELDDYLTGGLHASDCVEVEKHLISCEECRAWFHWSRDLRARASSLPGTIEPAHDLWPDIAARIAANQDSRRGVSIRLVDGVSTPGKTPGKSAAGAGSWIRQVSAIAAALSILVSLSVILTMTSGRMATAQQEWTISGIAGAPTIGRRPIGEGPIRVGELIETDGGSRAHIEVGDIGQVELQPNSRLRVLRTEADQHRMALDKGGIRALILAPPRLFFVETPSALAVDLGCAYELTVDDQGNGRLTVTAGWVALESGRNQSMVPSGAACVSRPGLGPGTPYFLDSSRDFQGALGLIDTGRSVDASLANLLASSRVRDTLSLWHLLPRVSGGQREQIWERLNELLPMPADVTRRGVLSLDQATLNRLKDDLEQFWF